MLGGVHALLSNWARLRIKTLSVIPDFAGPMHGANEGTPFEKLIEALKIYILALLRLQEIDL